MVGEGATIFLVLLASLLLTSYSAVLAAVEEAPAVLQAEGASDRRQPTLQSLARQYQLQRMPPS